MVDSPVFPPKYVLAGPVDFMSGERLYWSNEDGWVSRESATVFTQPVESLPMEWTGIKEV